MPWIIIGVGFRLGYKLLVQNGVILARIEALEKATAGDMAAIHADRVCIPARELVGLLGRLRVSAAAEPHRPQSSLRR